MVTSMEINIFAEAKKFEKDYICAFNEYVKRISPWTGLRLNLCKNLPSFNKQKNTAGYIVIPGTDTISSPQLAQKINTLNLNGISHISFYIPMQNNEYTSFAKDMEIFNLSSFSLSRELTAIALAEQLYRAYTIKSNITYHK